MSDFTNTTAYLSALLAERGQGIGNYVDEPVFNPKIEARFAKRTTFLTQQMTILNDALTSGTITNPVFKELSYWLNQILEDTWCVFAGYPYPTLHLIPSMLKRAEPGSRQQQFLTMVAPLAEAYKRIKSTEGMIVKRQPKVNTDDRYLAPRAGQTAAALVQQALFQVTEDNYQAVLNFCTGQYQGAVDAYLAATGTTGVIISDQVQAYLAPMRKKGNYDDFDLYRWVGLSATARGIAIAKQAKQDADFIRDRFVIKNLKKLDAIIEAKGNFASIKVLHGSLEIRSLVGRFLISFTDGSSFEVENSIVWARSVHGKVFHRFPLTFHNVFLADRTKMGRPSQERMNTVFVGKV